MPLKKVDFADTHSFTPFFLDYIQQSDKLKPFYHRFPNPSEFKNQIAEKEKSFTDTQREILSDVLTRQYQSLNISEPVKKNIQLLKDSKTFTVVTGHQLNIFTGPLYFIFKIVTVINTCKRLRQDHPGYNFVPMYWMASEDHDYEEIKSFRLYGKKYSWQTEQQGAVGRFSTEGLDALASSLPGDTMVFREAYTKQKRLSDAVRQYVHTLFEKEGIVVIDADDAALKSSFKRVIREDIFDSKNKSLVEKTNASLESLGYKPQIHCRDINFFYLENNLRSRIERKDDAYVVVDTDIRFTPEELHQVIEKNPERFSPNVILRPLYQEMILPNLAYVGGPAEVVYWLQLKHVFDYFGIAFPILMPRNFGLIVNAETSRKLEKTGLEIKDFFEEKNYLFNHWILQYSPRNLTVGEERSLMIEIFNRLRSRAETVDQTLAPFVSAESKRALNSLEHIERKFIRAEKRLHSDKLRQIEAVKDALFPNGKLQERTDNFLNFYQQDPKFIQVLLDGFDPFDFRFNIFLF
jgi:bacillithiol synthase